MMAQQQSQQQNFMQMLQLLFGSRSGGSVGAGAKAGNNFQSVQAGAGDNALPLSEQEKKKKEELKEKAKKKRRKAINQADEKAPVLGAINNKNPAANLGTLKIGLNLNQNNSKSDSANKQSKTSAGLNIYR